MKLKKNIGISLLFIILSYFLQAEEQELPVEIEFFNVPYLIKPGAKIDVEYKYKVNVTYYWSTICEAIDLTTAYVKDNKVNWNWFCTLYKGELTTPAKERYEKLTLDIPPKIPTGMIDFCLIIMKPPGRWPDNVNFVHRYAYCAKIEIKDPSKVSKFLEEEDKIIEALEQLRINYNLRQWRVCSLICESLAEKFKSLAKQRETRTEK